MKKTVPTPAPVIQIASFSKFFFMLRNVIYLEPLGLFDANCADKLMMKELMMSVMTGVTTLAVLMILMVMMIFIMIMVLIIIIMI